MPGREEIWRAKPAPTAPRYCFCCGERLVPASSAHWCSTSAIGWAAGERIYIRSSRLALPLRIFTLSSSHNDTDAIHWVASALSMKGQSTLRRLVAEGASQAPLFGWRIASAEPLRSRVTRRAGEMLIEAKDQVPYGSWSRWLVAAGTLGTV